MNAPRGIRTRTPSNPAAADRTATGIGRIEHGTPVLRGRRLARWAMAQPVEYFS
jgi:DNA-binding GntR family transcriptional regulator